MGILKSLGIERGNVFVADGLLDQKITDMRTPEEKKSKDLLESMLPHTAISILHLQGAVWKFLQGQDKFNFAGIHCHYEKKLGLSFALESQETTTPAIVKKRLKSLLGDIIENTERYVWVIQNEYESAVKKKNGVQLNYKTELTDSEVVSNLITPALHEKKQINMKPERKDTIGLHIYYMVRGQAGLFLVLVIPIYDIGDIVPQFLKESCKDCLNKLLPDAEKIASLLNSGIKTK